ncbi:MAG: cupin domain-containing protein [Candidatus Bipolaricaulota bacterium]
MISVNKSDEVKVSAITDLEGAAGVKKQVMLGEEENVATFAMRKFTLEEEGYTPFHEHDWEHEVYVLGGRGRIKTDEGFLDVESGDAVYVPPNERHQFINDGREMEFLCLVPNRGEPTVAER